MFSTTKEFQQWECKRRNLNWEKFTRFHGIGLSPRLTQSQFPRNQTRVNFPKVGFRLWHQAKPHQMPRRYPRGLRGRDLALGRLLLTFLWFPSSGTFLALIF